MNCVAATKGVAYFSYNAGVKNKKINCDTKSLVRVVSTIKGRREPPVSPGDSRSLNKKRL